MLWWEILSVGHRRHFNLDPFGKIISRKSVTMRYYTQLVGDCVCRWLYFFFVGQLWLGTLCFGVVTPVYNI